jgi:hypothetical protein
MPRLRPAGDARCLLHGIINTLLALRVTKQQEHILTFSFYFLPYKKDGIYSEYRNKPHCYRRHLFFWRTSISVFDHVKFLWFRYHKEQHTRRETVDSQFQQIVVSHLLRKHMSLLRAHTAQPVAEEPVWCSVVGSTLI